MPILIGGIIPTRRRPRIEGARDFRRSEFHKLAAISRVLESDFPDTLAFFTATAFLDKMPRWVRFSRTMRMIRSDRGGAPD